MTCKENNINHKPNFGSNISLEKEKRGNIKYLKYHWVASAQEKHPDTIFIHKYDSIWLKQKDKRITETLRRILSHETIHCILWYNGIYGELDVLVHKFKKQLKKDCKKTWLNYNVI